MVPIVIVAYEHAERLNILNAHILNLSIRDDFQRDTMKTDVFLSFLNLNS